MRLSKYIAHSGFCSRRDAEKLIKDNKVLINNSVCNDYSYSVNEQDKVCINNILLKKPNKVEMYILNKPRGYITSKKDELKRKTVYDLIPSDKKNLISIGRLDYNTEGLLLFTNNGDLARYFELPKNKISRIYKVKVYGNVTKQIINKINAGINIKGTVHQIDEIKLIKNLKTNSWYSIKLSEGKNREIRKIFENFNLTVNRIIRTNYGEYSLNNIKLGEFKKIILKKTIY